MGTTQPIKDINDIQRLKAYFLERKEYRNYAMVTLALNTSLRIGDLLDVYKRQFFNCSHPIAACISVTFKL